jgi:hypothetical protein
MSPRYCWRHFLALSIVCTMACVGSTANAEVASIYGGSDGHCGRPTANGERLNCGAMTAAHRTFPFGTLVRVCHSGCVIVRIMIAAPSFAAGILMWHQQPHERLG